MLANRDFEYISLFVANLYKVGGELGEIFLGKVASRCSSIVFGLPKNDSLFLSTLLDPLSLMILQVASLKLNGLLCMIDDLRPDCRLKTLTVSSKALPSIRAISRRVS